MAYIFIEDFHRDGTTIRKGVTLTKNLIVTENCVSMGSSAMFKDIPLTILEQFEEKKYKKVKKTAIIDDNVVKSKNDSARVSDKIDSLRKNSET